MFDWILNTPPESVSQDFSTKSLSVNAIDMVSKDVMPKQTNQ